MPPRHPLPRTPRSPLALALPLALAVALPLAACRDDAPRPSAVASASAPAVAAATASATASASAAPADPLDRAEAAAKLLGGTLRGKLEKAMAEGGPAKAIETCASEAQPIAAKVAADTGVRVGRASKKLRNPADAPPPWVAEWLDAQAGKKFADAKGVRAMADANGAKVARVIKPIELEAKCLACHGAPASLAPEVKAVLAARYPADAATGYEAGDLRGALWAEAR
jgi:hypothetical protein